jgi:hypothetical protein
MIDIIEKTALGFCALCVLLMLGAYLWLPVPSTGSIYFLPPVTHVAAPAPEGGASGGSAPAPLSQEDEEEERKILTVLREQERPIVPNQRIERYPYKVPPSLFEHVNNESNWTRELKTAKSKTLKTKNGETRLEITQIREDSLFRKFGFEESDVIEAIDGKILEFSEASTAEYYTLAHELLDKVRQGEEISVTVTRKNRPVHLQFRLDSLE